MESFEKKIRFHILGYTVYTTEGSLSTRPSLSQPTQLRVSKDADGVQAIGAPIQKAVSGFVVLYQIDSPSIWSM